MKKSLDQYDDAHDGVKKTWDIMQSDFECCGVSNSSDWKGKGSLGESKLNFIYSEKAAKFCEIFTLLLSYVVPVKSKVKISQNFVAFSEKLNFTIFM